jgi:hypothetical protein
MQKRGTRTRRELFSTDGGRFSFFCAGNVLLKGMLTDREAANGRKPGGFFIFADLEDVILLNAGSIKVNGCE